MRSARRLLGRLVAGSGRRAGAGIVRRLGPGKSPGHRAGAGIVRRLAPGKSPGHRAGPGGVRGLAPLACLVLFGVLAWHNTLDNGFVYDDEILVVQNEAIRTLTPLAKFFRPEAQYADADAESTRHTWRPLSVFVYALNYKASGLDPRAFHLTSAAIHVVNALLVFWLILLLFRPRAARAPQDPSEGRGLRGPPAATAFIAALVFLIHPVQTESVAFVGSRSNLVYLFFYLLAFILFVRSREKASRWAYGGSLACFALSLLSKEMAVTLPVALGFYLYLRGRAPQDGGKGRWSPLIPYFLLAGAYVLARSAALGQTAQTGYWAGGLAPQALTMLKGLAIYVKQTLLPYPLSLEYLFAVKHSLDPETLFFGLLLAALLWLGFRQMGRNPRTGFGILLFLLALAPVSNIVSINTVVNERYLYLSVIGWGLIVAELLAWTLSTRAGRNGAVRALGLAALCCLYLGVTTQRNKDWKDTFSLARANLETCPQSARLRYAMAKAYAERSQWDEAIGEYRIALAIELYGDDERGAVESVEPFGPDLLRRAGEYRKSLQVKVDRGQTYYSIGSAYLQKGEHRKAAAYLELAKGRKPTSAEIRNNLAVAHAYGGDPERAVQDLEDLLGDHPQDARARHNLGLFQDSLLAARASERGSPADAARGPSRAAGFVSELKERFPGLGEKWARLKGLRYEDSGQGVSPFAGYLGSAQAAGSLKPEERKALEALAGRSGAKTPAPPVFPKTYGKPYTVRLPLPSLPGRGQDEEETAVEIRPVGVSPAEAAVRDGIILYPDAYPETSVFFAASPAEVEEFYYLKSAKAPKAFVQELRPKGRIVSFRVNASGSLEARDAADAMVFQLSRPVVIDAEGRRAEGRFALQPAVSEKRGEDGHRAYLLTMLVQDSGLRYPLLIDPTWTTSGASSLASPRQQHTATLLPNGKVLVAGGWNGGSDLSTAELYDPVEGTWTATDSLAVARNVHTATLLPNGKVLVAGGYGSGTPLSTAELFDPSVGTNGEWATTDSMSDGRYGHTATLLHNGKVLIAGGFGLDGGGELSTAELYDPSAGSWSTTNPMPDVLGFHTATLLPDGKVLVAGGDSDPGVTDHAGLYDPTSGNWTATGSMSEQRYYHTATLLPNGKVLVAGGFNGSYLSTAELFDPSEGTWTTTDSLAQARRLHVATLLPDGRVLVAGGDQGSYLSTAEIFEPSSGTNGQWTTTDAMSAIRAAHSATLLPNGKVLVVAGANGAGGNHSSVELYDPSAGDWEATDSMSGARGYHAATLMPNGKVLVTGGDSGSVLSTVEIYDSATASWESADPMSTPRNYHISVLLPNGKVLVAGGTDGATRLSTAELYDPQSGLWSPTGSMTFEREAPGAVVLPNGKVLVAGGRDGASVLSSAEIYDPSVEAWLPTGSMSGQRMSFAAVLLDNGKVLVAGGADGGGPIASAELYDPASGSWTSAGSMSYSRLSPLGAKLENGKVLVFGGYNGGSLLSSAELYDPDLNSWAATGSMSAGHQGHSGALLPNGKVLVVGGQANLAGGAIDTAEVYDPASGAWTVIDNMTTPRRLLTATLLPNGKVLLAGGQDAADVFLSSAELALYTEYDFHLSTVAFLQPKIETIDGQGSFPVTLHPGDTYTVVGTTFAGGGEASGGGHGYANSPTNYPRVYLMPNDAGNFEAMAPGNRLVDLSTSVYGTAEQTYYQNGQSSTTLDFTIPADFQCGHYNFFI
ncbi:MAG: kelch repeat-containing protein, partial [Elusimicrobiota bacterium]